MTSTEPDAKGQPSQGVADEPVDAAALRQALAGMREMVATLRAELSLAHQRLDESTLRIAELESARLESTASVVPPRAGTGYRLVRLRRTLAYALLRLTPRAAVPFLWRNPLFDAEWYIMQYPDVHAARGAPERHYRRHGAAEGRDPSPLFDTDWYLGRYPDVAASGLNPLDHFHFLGATELRDPSPRFHTRWYLAHNPDVAATGMDPVLHYVRHGASEGRPPGPGGQDMPPGLRPHLATGIRQRVRRRIMPGRHGNQRRPSALDQVPGDVPIVIMLDDVFPRADRDAGSLLMQHYIHLFQGFGYHVHFVALREDGRHARYRTAIDDTGATTVDIGLDRVDVHNILEADGQRFDVAFLSRVTAGGLYAEEVARLSPKAKIIFNTQDLHFLREERAARLVGDEHGARRAAQLREQELRVIRRADATIVVSSAEKEILKDAAPDAAVYWCPLLQDPVGASADFAERSGIGFVGGFRHLPNVDAMRYFLDDIWPSIREIHPDLEFLAIGPDMPDEIRRRSDAGFVAVGHVPDLAPWLGRVRLTVAPMRFGAGMKGKILSSLAHGVPCVATPIAAEGIEPSGAGIVVAADASAFVEAVTRLYQDPSEWRTRSDEGLRWIETTVSVDRGRDRLARILVDIRAPLPVGAPPPVGPGT